MKVILINGSNRTGKDKFVKIFSRLSGRKVFEISTVDHIKKIAKKLGWDGVKDDKGRLFLVNLKKACVEYDNGPFNLVIKKIKKKQADVSFVHCREPEEINKFKEHYGDDLITVLMIKDDREVANNDSDRNVKNYEYDYYIDNNGTVEDLEKNVAEFVEKIKDKI